MARDVQPPSPPANIEAEQAILGAVMLTPECLDRLGRLEAEHFYDPVHADIYRIAWDKHARGEHVSPITMKGPLGDHAGLREIGGTQYLARLADSVIALSAVREYADAVINLYTRREIIGAAERAIEAARTGESPDGALTSLDGDLDVLRQHTQRRVASVSFGKALSSAMQRMVTARDEGPATPTGLATLDKKLGGLFAGNMILLGGRPGMGKTALAQSLARRIAKRGRAVAFASLEMTSDDLAIRMASEELREKGTRVPYTQARNGWVTDDEAEALMYAARGMERLPIEIIESHVRKLPHLHSEIRRLVTRWRARDMEIGAVFIDYLTLAQPGSDRWQNDNARISHVSQALKGIASELNVPMVVLAQLNRGVESREDKRPQMSDLRDSGSLEQDADAILFCYREEYYHERREPDRNDIDKWADWEAQRQRLKGRMEIIGAKQRMGPAFTVGVGCDLATNSFWDAER